jgi:hypothetical protein
MLPAFVASLSFLLITEEVAATSTSPSQLPKRDYSCYHSRSWVNNVNNHHNDLFSAYTDILESKFHDPSKSEQATPHVRRHLRAPSFFPAPNPLNMGSVAPHPQGSPPPNMNGSPPPHPLGSPPPNMNGSPPPNMNGSPPPNMNGSPPPHPLGSPPPNNQSPSNSFDAPPGGNQQGGGGGPMMDMSPKLTNVTLGWKVSFTDIPNYDHQITANEINELNSRPKASTDFLSGAHTTAKVDEMIVFGQNIGYKTSSGGCWLGYWPPGPGCPVATESSTVFTTTPAPELQPNHCYTRNQLGYFVNGVGIFDWTDAHSYESQGEWNNLAMEFEKYDLDICLGHAAEGVYHRKCKTVFFVAKLFLILSLLYSSDHSYSPCLANQLNDHGQGHSPIYGFAFDGFPLFGPYQSANTVAKSCWKKRDYSAASATGCSDGKRSCVLVDEFDISKGTKPVSSSSAVGPDFTQTLQTLSQNSLLAESGIFYEDYYYDPQCTTQGTEYLDAFNGHDHDDLGFHYHLTIDGNTGKPTFPYLTGPKYFGCQPNGMICEQSHSNNNNNNGGGGQNGQQGGGGGGGNGGQQPPPPPLLQLQQQLPPPPPSMAPAQQQQQQSSQPPTARVYSMCGVSQAIPLTQQQCLSESFTSPYLGTTSTSGETNSSDEDKQKIRLSSAAVVGIVVGVLFVVALVLFVVVRKCCCVGRSERRVSFSLPLATNLSSAGNETSTGVTAVVGNEMIHQNNHNRTPVLRAAAVVQPTAPTVPAQVVAPGSVGVHFI